MKKLAMLLVFAFAALVVPVTNAHTVKTASVASLDGSVPSTPPHW
jgi:hypothetical protein